MKKREPRRKVMIPARMRSNRGWADVMMRNVSSRGMLLECGETPDKGSYIEVRQGDHMMVCRVMWSEGAQFGVLAQDKLDLNAIVTTGSTKAPRRTEDEAIVERRLQERVSAAVLVSRAERNRLVAVAFQFAVIVAGSVVAVAFMAQTAKATLEEPLTAIAKRL